MSQVTIFDTFWCHLCSRKSLNSFKPIKGSNSICLGKSWVIKYSLDKIIQRLVHIHDKLANMDNLSCIFPEAVYSQYFPCFSMKQDFEDPWCSSKKLPFCNLIHLSNPNFIVHIFLGQLLFSLADHTHLRDSVDSIRESRNTMLQWHTPHMARCHPSLLHCCGCKCWKSNHIPSSIYMRHCRLVGFVYFDQPTIIKLKISCYLKIQFINCCFSANSIK
mmetsp:Transcript_30355/g.40063  ORF Transcript_30355/g.40063 Transcript_30355/m.40063 type:complete len:218 (-) Transcript_30355:1032-1685(-)